MRAIAFPLPDISLPGRAGRSWNGKAAAAKCLEVALRDICRGYTRAVGIGGKRTSTKIYEYAPWFERKAVGGAGKARLEDRCSAPLSIRLRG